MSKDYFEKVWGKSRKIFRKKAASVGPVLLKNLQSKLKFKLFCELASHF